MIQTRPPRFISHRGNLDGPQPNRENHPDYIDRAITFKYDVEVDVWKIDEKIYLGHDGPDWLVDMDWLNDRRQHLWIHCKNIAALEHSCRWYLHYFWHQEDDYTLTSKQWVWAYPDKPFAHKYNRTVTVLPEWNDTDVTGFAGICSDYIESYKNAHRSQFGTV